MQGQSRLVQQQDQVAVGGVLQLGEVGEEGEEPARALVEGHGDAVPAVADPDLQDGAFGQWRLLAGFGGTEDLELDLEFLVLRPVLEDLIGDRVAGVLGFADQPFWRPSCRGCYGLKVTRRSSVTSWMA